MDFFESQERARRRTRVLVFYFLLAVVCIIAAIYGVIVGFEAYGAQADGVRYVWRPEVLGVVAAGVTALIGAGSGWKSMQLAAGGAVVARDLGGRELPLEPSDPEERRLRNVVEEMALASGTPVPEIYLLEDEEGINAFAAGRTPADSAIGVTRGCVRHLSRDELQGVIAHEFSHILNGDMRLSTRLIGLLYGILLIAIVGRILFRFTAGSRRVSSGKKEGGAIPIALLGLALLLIGYIGVFFGKLIKSAVSRQREFLADASAVQFTRNPDGIGGALKKIGALSSRLQSPNAEEASHLFFANGMASSFARMFATHPPLEERIRAIEPRWDGTFPEPRPEPVAPSEARQTPPPLPGALKIAGFPAMGAVLLAEGGVSRRHIEHATGVRAALPEAVRSELRDPAGASAVIFALLLSEDSNVRESQVEAIADSMPAAVSVALTKVAGAVRTVESRLALVDLAMPALRQLSPAQYRAFLETLRRVVEADRRIDLFEFAVQKMVRRHLGVHFGDVRAPKIRFRFVQQVLPDVEVLLSALAYVGGGDPASAFAAGVAGLNAGAESLSLQSPDVCGLDRIEEALDRLAAAVPMVKKNLLHAAGQTVMADREMVPRELELLRAIADDLDAPIPPFVPSTEEHAAPVR